MSLSVGARAELEAEPLERGLVHHQKGLRADLLAQNSAALYAEPAPGEQLGDEPIGGCDGCRGARPRARRGGMGDDASAASSSKRAQPRASQLDEREPRRLGARRAAAAGHRRRRRCVRTSGCESLQKFARSARTPSPSEPKVTAGD